MAFFEAKPAQLDALWLTAFLFKASSFIVKTNVNSVAHIVPRLKIVDELLLSGFREKVISNQFPFEPVFSAVKACVYSPNQEARKVAMNVTISLYGAFGFEKVELLLADFSHKILVQLVEDIPELEKFVALKKQQ